jgi:hypothetical protein
LNDCYAILLFLQPLNFLRGDAIKYGEIIKGGAMLPALFSSRAREENSVDGRRINH